MSGSCDHPREGMRPTEDPNWLQCPCGMREWVAPKKLLAYMARRAW